jgi:hypothetical protein
MNGELFHGMFDTAQSKPREWVRIACMMGHPAIEKQPSVKELLLCPRRLPAGIRYAFVMPPGLRSVPLVNQP